MAPARIFRSWSNGRLIEAAGAFAASHAEVILIAASPASAESFAHRTTASTGLHRVTLHQFAADLARPAMAESRLTPLGSLGLEALAARVLQAARREQELRYFGPVAELPGFPRALARTLGELRLAGVRAPDLAATGAPGEDLARLLERYRRELEERGLADPARIFELASESAANHDGPSPARDARAAPPHRWLGLPILVLDAPLESAGHERFFAALARQAPEVLVAVTSEEEHFAAIPGVAPEDLDAKRPEGSIEHLRKYVFASAPPAMARADGRLEVFSAPGEALEAVEIARRILKLANEGIRFDQMAVLLRNPERYQALLEDALRRARIPAFFTRGTARPDPAGRAFLALLHCAAEKYSASRFAEYLSLAQVPSVGERAGEWVGPRDETLGIDATPGEEPARDPQPSAVRAPSRWERLLVDAAVIGGRDRWERRLHGLERELELQIENLDPAEAKPREHVTRQIEHLKELERFALPLIGMLTALPESATWEVWIESLGALARVALRRPEGVLAVLAELEPMSSVGPANLEEVCESLIERLLFLRQDPPERRYGRVFVSSIEESRGQEFSVVFVPGLAEGLFPRRTLEDPLLLDEFRAKIPAPLRTREQRGRDERIRLRLAVAAAGERLIASYPRMDSAESRPRVPSFYALELPRAIEGRLPEIQEFERRASEAAPARLNWPAPQRTSEAIDDAEFDLAKLANPAEGAAYLVQVNDALARSLRGRWKRWHAKWSDADGLISSDRAALEVLERHRLAARAWSPSALQRFAECPYQFALHGIFGLKPRADLEYLEQMDPLTRGALFHAVQFALLNDLRVAGLLPVGNATLTEALERADRALDRVAKDYRELLAPAIERVWDSEIEELRTDLRGWLQHVAQNDGEWAPVHFEFGFGLRKADGRDPASTTAEAVLDEGVRLRGSIDLVERHLTRGAYRVTDHKTGKRPDPIPHIVGGGKLLQPLLYGLAAQQILNATVECGRLFYATQRGGYVPVEIAVNDRSRQFLAKLLSHIDASIANGFLPPAPAKDVCERCDYRPVCGPYEERRLADFKNRADERLDGLVEIRGMA